ncbi:MAG: DEAD/DEAH box helicase [Candidatus Njordarchaeales archaeon]
MRNSATDEHEVEIEEMSNLLPEILLKRLKEIGIYKFRDFQCKAIEKGLQGNNLLIVAPTGSGKTLVGEVLAVSLLLKKGKKTLFLVPYKALAEELKNTLTFRYPFVKLGISTGDYREIPVKRLGWEYDLIIVTYEKADMIRRESPDWLSKVGLIIVDEIHLIGESDRGALLDAVITKFLELGIQIIALSATISNPDEIAEWLRAELIISNHRPVKLLEGVYLPKHSRIYFYDPKPAEEEKIIVKEKSVEEFSTPAQTLLDYFTENFLEEVKKILGTKVKIEEIKSGSAKIITRTLSYDDFSQTLMEIFYDRLDNGKIGYFEVKKNPISGRGFIKHVLDLTYDLLSMAKKYGQLWQILIFRRSRKLSQTTAEKIANMLEKTGLTKLFPEAPNVARELLETVDEVTPLTESLASVLRRGVAFHHAGLTREERILVERAFRERKIGVIVATPTLGAGINLPARRVIIEHIVYDPLLGRNVLISVAHYKQRAGRAGRPGLDVVGEAVLIASNERNAIEFFQRYILGTPEPISSFLGVHLPILRAQVLAYIVSEEKRRPNFIDMISFFKKTFYYWQALRRNDTYAITSLEENLLKSMEDLLSWHYIEAYTDNHKLSDKEAIHKITNPSTRFSPTIIGRKISQLYLDPVSARELIKVLTKWRTERKARELELLYAINRTPDTLSMRMKLLTDLQTLARFVLNIPTSIKEHEDFVLLIPQRLRICLESLAKGQYIELSQEEEDLLASVASTAILLLWINEIPVKDILTPFSPNFSGGDFRELIRVSEWLLYCSRELASTLRLSPSFLKKIDILRERVEHGITEELLELVKIPDVGRVRARRLKQYGFDTLEKIAQASVSKLSIIPGIGETLARKIIDYARKRIGKTGY